MVTATVTGQDQPRTGGPAPGGAPAAVGDSLPAGTVPEGAGPEGAGPEGAGPEGAGPEGAGPESAGPEGAAGPGEGLCWSWEIDLDTVLAAADREFARRKARRKPGSPGDARRPLAGGELAGAVAEAVPPGPELAGWLALADPAGAGDFALAGLADSWRRLGAWATAGELSVVAQMAARAAARDERVGLAGDGRPARVSMEAATEVALAETVSRGSAMWRAHLAVCLAWRLPEVGAALAAGRVDYSRAKAFCDATDRLSEDKARQVAARLLPEAGDWVLGNLKSRLRDAVMAADRDGAEGRVKDAEARARVRLYPDDEGTATLAGYNLPAVLAAAAMARMTALARARKADSGGGPLDLHRAQVMVGLLLGGLGLLPPAADSPTDQPPPAGDGPADGGPGGPGGPGPNDDGEEVPPPGDEDAPADDGLDDGGPVPADSDEPTDYADEDDERPGWVVPAWPHLPPVIPGVVPAAFIRPQAGKPDRPLPGLLDLTLPWSSLAGLSGQPGRLGRIGPITPGQAAGLAEVAAGDPATVWRVILTDPAGHAIAVTRIPGSRAGPIPGAGCQGPPGAARAGPPWRGLVGRVTVTIAEAAASRSPPATRPAGPGAGGQLARVLAACQRAARKAAQRAGEQAETDAAAGGCAHTRASPHYRPPPRLREYVVARDVTCRNPTCRQPAWQADLDHTVPHDQGGRTCGCNLGGRCRADHQVKQRPGWKLEQIRPGHFTWTTPAGRTYTTDPGTYPV